MPTFELLVWSLIIIAPLTIHLIWMRKKKLKYSNIPSPLGLPVVGHFLLSYFTPRSLRIWIIRYYLNYYGQIMMTWIFNLPVLHIGSAEYLENILPSSVHISKGFLYTFITPWLGTGLLTSTGKKWHLRRKILTPTFHFAILNMFTDIIVEKSAIFTELLQTKVDSEPFDILPFASACTLDIICEGAMGVKWDIQRGGDKSKEYIENVDTISKMIVHRITNGIIYPNFIHKLSSNYRQSKKALEVLHGMSLNIIEQRIAERKAALESEVDADQSEDEDKIGRKSPKAFLDLILDIKETDNTFSSVEDIREEVDTFMFEGHDTTAIAASWTIFAVGNHSDVQSKIYEELDEVFGDSDRPPNAQDLARLKYLECVIKETLRLYPPAPILCRQLSSDLKMGDYMIPADTIIMIHLHQIHRSPKYFPDPERFDPSRFSTDQIRQQHHYAYIPFSAGPRNCIGQKFAMIEAKIILSSFFRKFSVKSMEKMNKISLTPDIVLRPCNGIKVKLTAKDKKPNSV